MGEIVLIALLIPFAVVGLYAANQHLQYLFARRRVRRIESRWSFDPDLLFNRNGGEPLFMFDPGHTRSLFFLEGFQSSAIAGAYSDWFEELFHRHRTNIIASVYGIQSSPFDYRNRQWFFQECMRDVLQVYQAYCLPLPAGHRITTMSCSYGALPHTTILARAARPPDWACFLVPLNSGLDYRAGGELNRRLSERAALIRHLVRFTMARPARGRASGWDIVNDGFNREIEETIDFIPDQNALHAVHVRQAARYMEEGLIPQVRNQQILVVWGKMDLYFSQSGFKEFAAGLLRAGNRVETVELENAGHFVLLDNGREALRQTLVKGITGP